MRRPKSPLTPALTNAMQAPLDLSELNGKAADRRFLDSIRPIIEQAQREGEARETLKATVEAQKRAEAEKRKRDLEAQISAVMAKEKETGKRKDAAPTDNGPTPERLRMLMTGDGISLRETTPPIADGETRASSRTHEVQNVVDFYHGKWTDEEFQGARHLVKVWNEASSGQPTVTSAYTGVPGSASGPRDGGVRRGKSEHFVDKHWEVLKVEGVIFTNFGARGVNLVRWFAWETVRVAREGAALGEQMAAAGKSLAPFISAKSTDRLWGITFGHLQAIFRFAYSEWVMESGGRPRESSPQQIAARRAHRVRKMEQQGLLRADQDGPAFKEGKG